MSTEVKTTKKEHVDGNQGKTVITGFHGETIESEVTQLLREMINEIGMDFEEQKSNAPQNRSLMLSFASWTWRHKQVHQVSEHVEKRTERKKSKNNEINGC